MVSWTIVLTFANFSGWLFMHDREIKTKLDPQVKLPRHMWLMFMMSANNRTRFVLKIVVVCLYITSSHYHHCANLSEDNELIKCLSDIFCRVCKIRHILSVIHYTIRGAVCFQFTHSLCDDWENKYTLSYYHNQIGNMNHYPLFRVRSWNNGVRCMSFSILLRSLWPSADLWFVAWWYQADTRTNVD